MCACVRTTASAAIASGGSLALRARASSRRPWYMPQSMRSLPALVSTRCIEPVTSCAAPRKRTVVAMALAYLIHRETRRPRRIFQDQTANAVFQRRHVEVDEQTDWHAGYPQIG